MVNREDIQVQVFGLPTENGHYGCVEHVTGRWRIYFDENGDPMHLHCPTNSAGEILAEGLREDLRPLRDKRDSVPVREPVIRV